MHLPRRSLPHGNLQLHAQVCVSYVMAARKRNLRSSYEETLRQLSSHGHAVPAKCQLSSIRGRPGDQKRGFPCPRGTWMVLNWIQCNASYFRLNAAQSFAPMSTPMPRTISLWPCSRTTNVSRVLSIIASPGSKNQVAQPCAWHKAKSPCAFFNWLSPNHKRSRNPRPAALDVSFSSSIVISNMLETKEAGACQTPARTP